MFRHGRHDEKENPDGLYIMVCSLNIISLLSVLWELRRDEVCIPGSFIQFRTEADT